MHGNAEFIRQNRCVSPALPDKSGVPRARWFIARKRGNHLGIKPLRKRHSGLTL
jgi:hypothetical protein